MSGSQTSERIPVRVRALLAVLMALAMLIPAIGAYAQEAPGPQPVGNDKFCIDGSIINFNETIDFGQDENGNDIGADGWGITATPIDPAGGQVLSTTTDEDGLFSFDGLTPGKWQIAITLKPGFVMVPPYEQSFIVDLKYGMHDCAQVRFKMKRPVLVVACKIDDNHIPLADWTIRAEPAPGNWFASPVEEDTVLPDGCAKFSLTEGDWIFKERAPDGQAYMPVMPNNGVQRVTVEWQGPEVPITIRFKNRLFFQGCIVVTKTDVPPDTAQPAFGLPGWKITLKRTNGSVVASGLTDSQGNITFGHLNYGPYVVEEEKRVGWDPASSTGFTVVVNQPAGDDNTNCQVVNFQNRQNPPGFCITGRKIDTNGKIGLPGWVITATAVYNGGYPNEDIDGTSSLTTTTDGTGVYTFNFPQDDYRIPGAAYRVCEAQRDGWLPHTPYCQTVYLPKHPGACVKAWDFENQQVGHWESVIYGNNGGGSSSSCSTTHTVVAGESLFGIGAAYGVSGSAMLAANPWVNSRPNRYVFPGDSVCIP